MAERTGKVDEKFAARMDKIIDAYLASHKLSDDFAKAMYEGHPAIGMPEDALKLIAANYHVDAESESSKSISFTINDFALHTAEDTPIYRANIRDGKVVSLVNP